MVEYMQDFPTYGNNQGLPGDYIIEFMEYSLPCEWQKQLLVQGFDSSTKKLYELIDFCKHMETAEEIYYGNGELTHHDKKTKQSSSRNQSVNPDSKGSNQTAKTSVEGAETKQNNIYKPSCILHGLGHDVNPWKVVQV